MEILKKKFFDTKDKDLGRVLDSELGGHFEQIIFNALQASEETYDEEYHNDEKVKEDTEAFYKMGQGKWGTDEKGLFKLICARPAEHVSQIAGGWNQSLSIVALIILPPIFLPLYCSFAK